jgi:hypothetical protein
MDNLGSFVLLDEQAEAAVEQGIDRHIVSQDEEIDILGFVHGGSPQRLSGDEQGSQGEAHGPESPVDQTTAPAADQAQAAAWVDTDRSGLACRTPSGRDSAVAGRCEAGGDHIVDRAPERSDTANRLA